MRQANLPQYSEWGGCNQSQCISFKVSLGDAPPTCILRITRVVMLNLLAKERLMLGYNEEVETAGEEFLVSHVTMHGMGKPKMSRSPLHGGRPPVPLTVEKKYSNSKRKLRNVSQCVLSFGSCCARFGTVCPARRLLGGDQPCWW